MARIEGTISEIFETGEGTGLGIRVQNPVNFQPGQYFQGMSTVPGEVLPLTLYPFQITGQVLFVMPSRASTWWVGQEIRLRGALGNGFHLPAAAERIGLVNYGKGKALGLLSLAEALLSTGKEVALVTNAPLQGLPMALEILAADQAKEVADWSDAMAFSAVTEEIADLIGRFGWLGLRKSVEVLIQTEMPCGGSAACGVCAIQTKKGWRYICKDGPVFPLAELAAG